MPFFKTIILVPNPNLPGGVSNYYKVAKNHFSSSTRYIYFNSKYKNGSLKILCNCLHILKVLTIISFSFPNRIVVNPSLGRNAFLRDGLFIVWAHLFFRKTIVFWRGWNKKNENIFHSKLLSLFFKLSFRRSSKQFVLNKHVHSMLIDQRIKPDRIFFTNTIVEDSFVENQVEKQQNTNFVILFLTRIEKYKGIYETIELFERIQKSGLEIELHIAGHGAELNNIKDLVDKKNLCNVSFLGYVDGEKKLSVFKNSDVYLFPSYSEGMPNSVLEAMGCGLPIVCTNVGALEDFFEDGKMGFMHPLPINLSFLEESILKIYSNKELQQNMSKYNCFYAKEHFLASKSIKKLESIINE